MQSGQESVRQQRRSERNRIPLIGWNRRERYVVTQHEPRSATGVQSRKGIVHRRGPIFA
jgi:hypothetical protein